MATPYQSHISEPGYAQAIAGLKLVDWGRTFSEAISTANQSQQVANQTASVAAESALDSVKASSLVLEGGLRIAQQRLAEQRQPAEIEFMQAQADNLRSIVQDRVAKAPVEMRVMESNIAAQEADTASKQLLDPLRVQLFGEQVKALNFQNSKAMQDITLAKATAETAQRQSEATTAQVVALSAKDTAGFANDWGAKWPALKSANPDEIDRQFKATLAKYPTMNPTVRAQMQAEVDAHLDTIAIPVTGLDGKPSSMSALKVRNLRQEASGLGLTLSEAFNNDMKRKAEETRLSLVGQQIALGRDPASASAVAMEQMKLGQLAQQSEMSLQRQALLKTAVSFDPSTVAAQLTSALKDPETAKSINFAELAKDPTTLVKTLTANPELFKNSLSVNVDGTAVQVPFRDMVAALAAKAVEAEKMQLDGYKAKLAQGKVRPTAVFGDFALDQPASGFALDALQSIGSGTEAGLTYLLNLGQTEDILTLERKQLIRNPVISEVATSVAKELDSRAVELTQQLSEEMPLEKRQAIAATLTRIQSLREFINPSRTLAFKQTWGIEKRRVTEADIRAIAGLFSTGRELRMGNLDSDYGAKLAALSSMHTTLDQLIGNKPMTAMGNLTYLNSILENYGGAPAAGAAGSNTTGTVDPFGVLSAPAAAKK